MTRLEGSDIARVNAMLSALEAAKPYVFSLLLQGVVRLKGNTAVAQLVSIETSATARKVCSHALGMTLTKLSRRVINETLVLLAGVE